MFNSRFGNGIVAAFEEEGGDNVEAVEVEVGGDSAEAALGEVAESAVAVTDTTDNIEAAAADADALDEIVAVAEKAEGEGGLEPAAAEAIEVAVESIYNRLGIKKKPLVSVEAFSNKATKLRATNVAIEDWKEQVKKIWAAIVAAFTKVVDWLKNFFRTLFDSSAKLSARATAVKNAVKGKGGAAAKEAEIAGGGFVKKLATAEGFDSGKAIAGVAGLAESLSFAVNVGGISYDWAKLVSDKGAFEGFATKTPGTAAKTSKKAPEGYVWVGASDLLGNKTILMLNPAEGKKGAEALQALRGVKVEAGDTNPKLELKAEKVPTLGLDDISKMADGVIAAAKSINTQQSLVGTLEGNLKNVINDANSIAKLADSKADEGIGARAKAVSGAVTADTNGRIKLITMVFGHAVSTAHAGLDYAEKSLKQYEGKKEEPAAAK